VTLWDTATGKKLAVLMRPKPANEFVSGVTGVAFSSDGMTLAASSLDKQVRVWNLRKLRFQ
jgi:WD40 repeat protein